MSEDRFEEEREDEVEAHRKVRLGTDEPRSEGESDDVELHRKVRLGSEEKGSDKDVEAHKKQAMHEEPGSEEESDDVEAHMRRHMKHRNL